VKKFLAIALTSSFLVSCSPDKNELQPKLGNSSRAPVNSGFGTNYSQSEAPSANYDPSSQAEVFANQNIGLGSAPAAIGGVAETPVQKAAIGELAPQLNSEVQMNPQALQAMNPSSQGNIPNPLPTQANNLPFAMPIQQDTQQQSIQTMAFSMQGNQYAMPAQFANQTQIQAIPNHNQANIGAQVATNKRIPTSLDNNYANPLNSTVIATNTQTYSGPAAFSAPVAMPQMAIPAEQQMMMPMPQMAMPSNSPMMAPYGAPMNSMANMMPHNNMMNSAPQGFMAQPIIQPVGQPTQPVNSLQVSYPQR
jgi:hypothetical protein